MTPEGCAHRWHILPPSGRTSPGICVRCAEKREFTNYVARTMRDSGGRPPAVVAREMAEIARQYGAGSGFPDWRNHLDAMLRLVA